MAGESLSMFPSGFKALKLYSQIPIDGVGDFDVSRPSVATRINKLGLIETMLANVPLIDYTDGVCPVLLVQPQSTNYIRYNIDLNNLARWTYNGCTHNGYVLAPDGTTRASNITFSSIGNNLRGDPSLGSSSGDFSSFFYVRSDFENQDFRFEYQDTAAGNRTSPTFTATSEWVKYIFGRNTSGFISQMRLHAMVNGLNIDVAFPQFEDMEFSTSMIETEATTVTRLVDIVTVAPPVGTVSIVETIDNVDQTPIIIIPGTFTVSEGNINKITMT